MVVIVKTICQNKRNSFFSIQILLVILNGSLYCLNAEILIYSSHYSRSSITNFSIYLNILAWVAEVIAISWWFRSKSYVTQCIFMTFLFNCVSQIDGQGFLVLLMWLKNGVSSFWPDINVMQYCKNLKWCLILYYQTII